MLPSWISKYVGIKFVERGRSFEGVDCWGLLKLMYQTELGILLPDYGPDYRDINDDVSIVRLARKEIRCNWDKVEVPRLLDGVMFNIERRPVHVGIAIDRINFIHAPEGDYTRIERLTDRMWVRRVEGVYRRRPLPGSGSPESAQD